MIHSEIRPREWNAIYSEIVHESSVNSIAFAPHEYGLMLACAASDGKVSVLQHQPNQTWSVSYLKDCGMGVNAVSWAPFGAYHDKNQPDSPQKPRLVTAGCDNSIRFWKFSDNEWIEETESVVDETANKHSDWVRDVAWAPTLLPNENIVASCSEDKSVLIWKQSGADAKWTSTALQFEAPVWRVSWSVTGHLLAVSSGDSDVTLWKESLDGQWSQVSTVEDAPPVEQPQS